MLRYVVLRLLSAIPVMAVVVVVVFLLLHLAPGDPAAMVAGDVASPGQIALIRAHLRLDEPLPVQFGIWLGHLLSLDLGTSVFSDLPVTRLIGQRIEPTLMLALITTVLATLYAVPLGILAAWRARTAVDRSVIGLSIAGFSIPVFIIGYALMYVFALKLGWLPVQGYRPLSEGVLECLRTLVLPSTALAVVFGAILSRVTRAAMLEVLEEDFIRTARAKGAGTVRILVAHALRNAGMPVVTIIGIGFASLIGGVVVTESVFNIPGIGRLTVEAILHRDYPVVQGTLLVFSGALVIVNLLVDLAYGGLDPRVRY